jgi:pimeloyl-ACP methyl ester carboxylesterase
MPGSHRDILRSIRTSVNGVSIHARISEDQVPSTAPSVVLVHGLSVSSGYMIPTAERLSAFYRVYVPDLPGFGKSGKPSHILPPVSGALSVRCYTLSRTP